MSTTAPLKSLSIDNINPHVKAAQYAVRGTLALRAEDYKKRLAEGDKSLPFDKVINANIGNPQQLDQKPITFFRQVLSLLEYPVLLEDTDPKKVELVKALYPRDAIERAKILLKALNSLGSYTHSQGVPKIRETVAKYIEERDGYPSSPDSIYLTGGASGGVEKILEIICSKPSTGVMIPIPQYPLYTATLARYGAKAVEYFLDEESAWETDISNLQEVHSRAKSQRIDVRCICVINPGNPTGASLDVSQIKGIIEIAAKEKLVIIADEVYQTNVFLGEFTSFKKVLRDLQKAHPGMFDEVELVSLHSISKGMIGECGHRGGYFELVGFDSKVVQQIYKLSSIGLCAPSTGQCLVELMCNPPKEGDESYPLYKKEYETIREGLLRRANALFETFKKMEGVSCQDPAGAMYLFPRITLPPAAIQRAEKEGQKPDEFYCLRLLDATGVSVVPGSGFGQKEGTFHFRTTFLAPGTEWTSRIEKFHADFMDEFREKGDAKQ